MGPHISFRFVGSQPGLGYIGAAAPTFANRTIPRMSGPIHISCPVRAPANCKQTSAGTYSAFAPMRGSTDRQSLPPLLFPPPLPSLHETFSWSAVDQSSHSGSALLCLALFTPLLETSRNLPPIPGYALFCPVRDPLALDEGKHHPCPPWTGII